MAEDQNLGNNINVAHAGLYLNTSTSQVPKGKLTFAMNAVIEGFDGEKVSYQNELGNEICITFPTGYRVIGRHPIHEKDVIVFWLASVNSSEIGIIDVRTCTYTTFINAPCLNLDVNHPIHKAFTRITSTTTEVYWTDGKNKMRWLDLLNPPYREIINGCDTIVTADIDCNKLNVQPNFRIPQINLVNVDIDGEIEAGTYQLAAQYANSNGQGYTSYYSVTNPIPIRDKSKITQDFDYLVSASINWRIDNIDTTGFYEYINVAVIKTVNNITSAELLGTYLITGSNLSVRYSGQKGLIKVDMHEVFEKFPHYQTAQDIFTVQDVIGWANVTTTERVNYQKIWSKVHLQWESHIAPKDIYSESESAANYKGYFRDEVYALEGVFLLANGEQTDRFHIPGRASISSDWDSFNNADIVTEDYGLCPPDAREPQPRWKLYNTAHDTKYTDEYVNAPTKHCYIGPFQYGEFAYWESTDLYPCGEEWGSLANQPIRHHKFPDSTITHIHDENNNVIPLGIRIDTAQIQNLINTSDLTQEQKDNIVGFKIVRANRANNKSIIARGILNNVGKYTRERVTYFYPNYPYNDLRTDPFINSQNNSRNNPDPGAGNGMCINYQLELAAGATTGLVVTYTDCTGVSQDIALAGKTFVCSSTQPVVKTPYSSAHAAIIPLGECGPDTPAESADVVDTTVTPLEGFGSIDSRLRYTFHSPDTHFYQPTLGNVLKLEAAIYGKADVHFQQVKKHARYKMPTLQSYVLALGVGVTIGFLGGMKGTTNQLFDAVAALTGYQVFTDIIYRLIPRLNYCYQYNSAGNYDQYTIVPIGGNKQRRIDIGGYLTPGFHALGDTYRINNFQRESSVYLKTNLDLPTPDTYSGIIDNSRFVIGDIANKCEKDHFADVEERDICSYYGTIKRLAPNQYGRMYSYESIDTGTQYMFSQGIPNIVAFGGDCFINKFALKTKLPFFVDHRVNVTDESDIDFREYANIGYPRFWLSTDISQGRGGRFKIGSLFGEMDTHFDCKGVKFFYKTGKMYLFAYGIQNFFCESAVNVDYRQAYNDKEGDFYPRMSSHIPDEWFQESNVTIQHDNTYVYNKTFSKQNKENHFSFIPENYNPVDQVQDFAAIYSEKRNNMQDSTKINNWLIYRPINKFYFPQNYGKLTSLDGIENRQVLARFENKSLLYNALYTVNTSSPTQVYLGQGLFSDDAPPLDFAETDAGYAGSQHKLFLRTEYGHVTIDSKRGQVFLFQGNRMAEISNEEVSNFLGENLPFKIKETFFDINTDNHFNGIGLHGVYDSKNSRVLITKLDYEPVVPNMQYINGQFLVNQIPVDLTDTNYFANKSFTISYNFKTKSWISFHSYLPNFYVGMPKAFYSSKENGLWIHGANRTLFQNFYSKIEPYIIEYPFKSQYQDDILQSIKDYTRVTKVNPDSSSIQVDDVWFNKAILYNNQQCSGILNLDKKPKNNLQAQLNYPVYLADSKTILYTKSDNFYNYNTFWSLLRNKTQPTFIYTRDSVHPTINQAVMDYSKLAFKKEPLRGKELKVRHILDNKDDHSLVSEFIVTQTQKSYK